MIVRVSSMLGLKRKTKFGKSSCGDNEKRSFLCMSHPYCEMIIILSLSFHEN